MYIKDILFQGEYNTASDVKALEFKKITFRPEDMDAECIYFYIKGRKREAETVKKLLLEKMPVCVVCEEDFSDLFSGIAVLTCKNVRELLAFAYARFYGIDMKRLKFAGVTGTNGKTTVATMICEILAEEGKKVGFIGTGKIISDTRTLTPFDYSMTTPDPDLLYSSIKRMEDDGCEYIVMEVSSHSLAYDKVAPIYFDVAVFTNLSHEHMDFHGDTEEYYQTKMKLFEKAKLGIFNIDDEYARRGFSECECEKKSVGVLWDADVMAKEPHSLGFSGSSYLYRAKDFIFRMNLPLVGAYNIYNSLCAISAAHALGARPCIAKRALKKMKSPEGRFEIINDDVMVIIDYAHTPEALENVLKTINSCKNAGQKLFCVFGCGGDRDKDKRPLMGEVAEKNSDFVVVTEDNSRGEVREKIITDILSGISDKSRSAAIPSREDAIECAVLDAPVGAVIAVLGKGAERYNIDKDGVHPFDEREIIKNALLKRKGEGKNEGKA